MKPRDLSDLALRNLREALLRNSLTTLGIAVGVASLVAMLSLGVGLQQLAAKRLSQSGLFDSVFVTPRMNLRGMGRAAMPPSLDKEPRLPPSQRRRSLSSGSFFHGSSLRRQAIRHHGCRHARILQIERFL